MGEDFKGNGEYNNRGARPAFRGVDMLRGRVRQLKGSAVPDFFKFATVKACYAFAVHTETTALAFGCSLDECVFAR